jgi:uncharacterized protein
MILRVLLSVFCLILAPSVFAQEDLPEYKGWVNDTAGVISSDYREKIENLISELEEKTSAEITVVTRTSTAPLSEFDYAQALFDKWKIGKKGKDNGVLILLVSSQRRWRIHTGYGVEGILTDAICSQIGRNRMVPFFKEGKFSEGLYYGVAAVADIISKDARVHLSGLKSVKFKKPPQHVPVFMYFFMFFFFLIWNLPWPIFIGLPATLLFAWGFSHLSIWLGVLAMTAYAASMFWRFLIWKKIPLDQRGSFGQVILRGLPSMGRGSGNSSGYGGGGFSSGGGSGSSGGGGGSSGGGGAGGGF